MAYFCLIPPDQLHTARSKRLINSSPGRLPEHNGKLNKGSDKQGMQLWDSLAAKWDCYCWKLPAGPLQHCRYWFEPPPRLQWTITACVIKGMKGRKLESSIRGSDVKNYIFCLLPDPMESHDHISTPILYVGAIFIEHRSNSMHDSI